MSKSFQNLKYDLPSGGVRQVFVKFPSSDFLACGKGLTIRTDCNTKETKKTYNFTLYSYINENDISIQNVNGEKEPKNTIRILGYKLSGKPYYTTLLEL